MIKSSILGQICLTFYINFSSMLITVKEKFFVQNSEKNAAKIRHLEV